MLNWKPLNLSHCTFFLGFHRNLPIAAEFSSCHPSIMPRKKSLLIGINYTGSNHQLNGCINDAMNVREYLVRDHGYSTDQRDMVILTDAPENRGTPFYATGANMLAAFSWLVSGNNPGDSLWLSYSGHGSRFLTQAYKQKSAFSD
jgi:hypothetical protein